MSVTINSSAEPELQPSAHSCVTSEGQRVLSPILPIAEAFELALVVVNDLVFAKRGKYLTETELIIVKGALNDLDYEEIASNSTYTLNYLQRCVAPQLWDTLSETIGNGERVGKKKLWYFLEQVNQKYHIQSLSSERQAFIANKEQESSSNKLLQTITGQLPDLSSFYGRTQELAELKRLTAKQRCISLVGVPGIGKSALAAKLITEVSAESQPRFDCLIWKSVSHAPLLQDLINDLIELTRQSLEPGSDLPQYIQAMISILVKQLQSRRCLIVLDSFEALFQRTNFQHRLEYGLFLNRLIEEDHQSCLLLTSRILPDELDILIRTKPHIQSLKLEGLDVDAAKQLLFAQGLTDEENYNELIKTYCGNPLELKAVVNRITRFFDGSAESFFQNKTTLISSEFQSVLDEMFGQVLTEIQRQIMNCIAEELVLTSMPVSFANLLKGLNRNPKLSISTSELITALEKLERLSLIESGKDTVTKEINFTLQPVIKKYIKTDHQRLVRPSSVSPTLAIAS
ncbi:MAG: NACHT domain-containing protein [Komarekiella atlantica HA4396-MV6]|jgi:hypothetical protein|nr:NACHT domain-containing protein [Komarekiella atlantica HA4396-MV6]